MSRFITFEGGEGTGKSTQAQLLGQHLRAEGHSVILTREPGGTDGAELIRTLLVSGSITRWDPMTEVLLLYAARLDHWRKVIQPALQKNQWVICDRFSDSTLAYQGYGMGVELSFIREIHSSVLGSVTPDLTFVFDLDPAIGVRRALERHTSETRFENMDLSFHHRMRQGFLNIAADHPERCHILDASQNIDVVFQEILSTLRAVKF